MLVLLCEGPGSTPTESEPWWWLYVEPEFRITGLEALHESISCYVEFRSSADSQTGGPRGFLMAGPTFIFAQHQSHPHLKGLILSATPDCIPWNRS